MMKQMNRALQIKTIKKAYDILLFNKIDTFPIDSVKIATCFGFILKCDYNIKALTLFDEKTNKYAIIFNPNNDDMLFSVAHELGHIFMGHFRDGNLVKMGEAKGKYAFYEEQADLFAYCLLFPFHILRVNSNLAIGGLEDIKKTAIQISLNSSFIELNGIEEKILALFKVSI